MIKGNRGFWSHVKFKVRIEVPRFYAVQVGKKVHYKMSQNIFSDNTLEEQDD